MPSKLKWYPGTIRALLKHFDVIHEILGHLDILRQILGLVKTFRTELHFSGL